MELSDANIQVSIITFDDDFMAKSYVKNTQIDFPLLLDEPGEKTYNAYGMQRANWWALYNPLSILKYIYLILTGTRPGKPGKDWNQLGGDVLVDPNGVVRYHYASQSPHDRPSVDTILETVRAMQTRS